MDYFTNRTETSLIEVRWISPRIVWKSVGLMICSEAETSWSNLSQKKATFFDKNLNADGLKTSSYFISLLFLWTLKAVGQNYHAQNMCETLGHETHS